MNRTGRCYADAGTLCEPSCTAWSFSLGLRPLIRRVDSWSMKFPRQHRIFHHVTEYGEPSGPHVTPLLIEHPHFDPERPDAEESRPVQARRSYRV